MPRMAESARRGQTSPPAGEQIILGVDTHKDTHVAVLVSTVGTVIGGQAFPATAAGFRRLLAWAWSFGVVSRAGVEGTGCYGAALTRYLRAQNVRVLEVNRPDRAARRRRGKSDLLDGEAAALAVLSGRAVVVPKNADCPTEALRVLTCPGIPRSRPAPRRSTRSGRSPSAPIRNCGKACPGSAPRA